MALKILCTQYHYLLLFLLNCKILPYIHAMRTKAMQTSTPHTTCLFFSKMFQPYSNYVTELSHLYLLFAIVAIIKLFL